MAAVNWWWLCLALPFGALFNGNACTTIDPKSTSGNDTDISQEQQEVPTVEDNATLTVGDSELSASERTRRLIPYMAFYLPVQELPINQQYASIHSTKHGAGPSATGASGSHIPLPPQYVHVKLPALSGLGSGTGGGTSYLQSAPAVTHYQASAGDVYHSLAYGGPQQQQQQPQPHPQPHYQLLSTGIKQIDNNGNHKYPGHHLLSAGPPGPSAPSTVNLAGVKINPIRQKTVQHFPPLPSKSATATSSSSAYETSSVKQHQQQQQRGIAYRPRTKQSKINLTPFTPANSVPGNFVPIVYTPVNSNNNNNKNNIVITSQAGATADNTNFNNAAATVLNGGGKQQQIAIEYSAPLAAPIDEAPQHHRPPTQHHHIQHQHLHPPHNPKQQGQYFSVTPSPLSPSGSEAVGPGDSSQHQLTQTVGPPSTFHQQQQHPGHLLVDAASRPPQQSEQLTLIASKQQQTQQQFRIKNTHFHPSKPENFFDTELQLLPQQQQQHHHHHHHHVEQQRPRYSDKQQPPHPQTQQHEPTQEQHQQYLTKAKYRGRIKQPAHIFVLSSTAAPNDGTVTALSPIQPPQNSHYSSKYPQHSSIHHPLYPRPELDSTHGQQNLQNNEASSSPTQSHLPFGEQILTIPVHSLFSDLRNYQHNHFPSPASSSSSHNLQYPKAHGAPSTPQYIDYPVDEPKQSLDEEQNEPYQQHQQQHHIQHELETLKPTLGPPSHAYIIVTTAGPFHRHPETQENYGATTRPPLYNNKPNVRLQPVSNEKNANYPAIRQPNPTKKSVVPITPTSTPNTLISDAAPKYVYVKEEFGQKLSTPSIKLKPLNKYENDNQMPTKQHHPQELQHLVSRPPNHALGKGPSVASTDIAVQPHQQLHSPNILADPNELPDIRTSSLAEILHKLQESNHLPHTLTADNIDNSIKTLIRILNNLKKTQTIVANPPQHHETPPPSSSDYDYTAGSDEQEHSDHPPQHDTGPNKHPGPSTGRPGIDYPNYAKIPQTSFDCSQQRYKGFFGDPETSCQVWHYCDLNGGKASFLCPNGTIFSQIALTCDWWFNVKCASTAQLYVLNERLYKYILPFTPKFPEDYSGPLVDKYLAMKFQEMEEKMRIEKEKALEQKALEEAGTEHEIEHEATSEDRSEENHIDETTAENEPLHPSVAPPIHKPESVNSHVSEQSSERNLLIDDEVDDISQRGSIDTFESTTIATVKPKDLPLSLRPIVVSSTVEPDEDVGEDDQQQQSHEDVKRHGEKNITHKTDMNKQHKTRKDTLVNTTDKHMASRANSKTNDMKISVEKVEVIEIKPDGATGQLIREMILKSETK